MKNKNVFIVGLSIIIIFCLVILVSCLGYDYKAISIRDYKGNMKYPTDIKESVFIVNYGRKIDSISYCFTKSNKCNSQKVYDNFNSSFFIKLDFDYPETNDDVRFCYIINIGNSSYENCNKKKFSVYKDKPIISSKYNIISISDKYNVKSLEDLFNVKAKSGIKSFKCNNSGNKINCTALGNNDLKSNYEVNVDNSLVNKLENKSIVFYGDSITEASKRFDNFGGFASRVGFTNYMDWYNYGVGGATISKSKKHITNQLLDDKKRDYDYVIMQGGINDSYYKVKLGSITDSFDVKDFDNKTYAGGLEELFYYAKKNYKNSKFGFIITYKTPLSSWGENVQNRDEQIKLTKKICDKWDIPYLDLYSGSVYINGMSYKYSKLLDVENGSNFYRKTDVHLSGSGYDIVSKYITIWLKTL